VTRFLNLSLNEMGHRALVCGLLIVAVLGGCLPVQLEDRPQPDPVIAKYILGDGTTITWDRARSRPLAFSKFIGVLGTSATPLYVRLIEHQQPAGAAVRHFQHANGTVEKLIAGEGTYVWAPDAVQVAGADGRSIAFLEYFLTYFGEIVFQEDLRDWPKT
jgi:hypothetical protein